MAHSDKLFQLATHLTISQRLAFVAILVAMTAMGNAGDPLKGPERTREVWKEYPDPEDFLAAIRGDARIEISWLPDGYFRLLNCRDGGGDFPIQYVLNKVAENQIVLTLRPGGSFAGAKETVVIPIDRIVEISRIEGPGK